MSQDKTVTIVSTSTDGYYYNVYEKNDTERTKAVYFGKITHDGKNDQCTCMGFTILSKCYHNKKAREIMEIPL